MFNICRSSSIKSKQRRKIQDDLNFQNLEQAEEGGVILRREASLQLSDEEEEEEEKEGEHDNEEEEMELEDDDYMADHYASDNDMGDDGGDGEAVF
jgi:hypothetical protein